jgi:hypothetical protein
MFRLIAAVVLLHVSLSTSVQAQAAKTTSGATRMCSTFKGATAAAKIAACIADVPAAGGIADARGLEGEGWTACPVTDVAKPVELVLGSETTPVSVNCVVARPVTLNLPFGAILSPAAGTTFTINGGISASMSRHFSGDGTVRLNTTRVLEVYPQWWGAAGDNIADDTIPIQRTIDAFETGRGQIRFTCDYFKITDTIKISKNRINLTGCGKQTTIFTFLPIGPKSAFRVSAGTAELFQGSMKNFTLTSTDTRFKKVGIELVDTSEYTIEDVTVTRWSGDASEAFKVAGREATYLYRLETNADLPLHIADNPNSTIDCDHLSVVDSYFIGTLTGTALPIVQIDSGVNLTNANFTRGAWVGGKYGLYWSDRASVGISESLTMRDIRWEQSPVTDGNFVYISHNYSLYNLILENLRWGSVTNGIYLRRVNQVTLSNLLYDRSGTALDIASPTVDQVDLRNVRIVSAAAGVNIAGATHVSGCYTHATNVVCLSPAPVSEGK